MTSFEQFHGPTARALDQGNRLSEDEIQKTAEYYTAEMQERTAGPQLEAMEKEWLEKALREDPGVFLVEIPGDNNEVIRWPLLTPVQHHEGYDPQFFNKHFEGRNVLYFEIPPYTALDTLLADEVRMQAIAEHLLQTDAVIAYDLRVGDSLAESTPEFLKRILESKQATLSDTTPHNIAFGVDYGLPTGTYYEGKAELTRPVDNPVESISQAIKARTTVMHEGQERLLPLPENGPALLNPDYLKDEKIKDSLWKMYLKQFLNLGEDHPLYTHSPPEEFIQMLSDPEAINTIAMDEGNIVGLLDLVNNVEKCPWLNPRYYNEKYGGSDVWVGFFPGIVIAEGKARQGLGHVQGMMRIAGEVVMDVGKDLVIAFGCTGASRTYIPKVVQGFFEGDPTKGNPGFDGLKLKINQNGEGFDATAEYEYHTLEVHPPASVSG